MKPVLLVSTRTAAGKTSVGLGLALCWKEMGLKVGYFKPWADRLEQKKGIIYDRDASIFLSSLEITNSLEDFSIAHDYEMLLENSRKSKTDHQTLLIEGFERLSRGKDLVIIEGPRNYSYGSYIQLSAGKIATALASKVIIVANGDMGVVMDKTLACNYLMESRGANILGVVINGVKDQMLKNMEQIACPALEEEGIDILGIIPWEPKISRLTPKLIAEKLGAQVIAGEEGIDREVEHTLVGAMTVDHALKGMRKFRNIALITGGDRTDMQLASLEVSLSCLVLTGGVYPDVMVLSKADQLNIPVLLVKEHTYETARYVERIEPWIKAEDKGKIAQLGNLIKDSVEVKKITNLL